MLVDSVSAVSAPKSGPSKKHTDHTDAVLTKMWAAGSEVKDIAARLRFARSTVSLRRQELGLPGRAATKCCDDGWTEERLAEITKLWNTTDMTAVQIAEFFNERDKTSFTKNAIVGKARRLKLNKRTTADPLSGKRPRAKKARTQKERRAGRAPAAQRVITAKGKKNLQTFADIRAAKPATAEQLAGVPIVDDTRENVVQMRDLGARSCKWPFGDPQAESFGFCGCRAQLNQPYCLEHSRIAYQCNEVVAATHPTRVYSSTPR